MKTLLNNALILKMDGSSIFEGNILINDSRIEIISKESINESHDQEIDCTHNLLMPGFKNAHTHSAMTFLRSKTDGLKLQDWLFDVVFPREKVLIEEDVYRFAKVAFLEYIRGGITACFDQYFFPPMTAKAAEDIGMRVVLLGTYNGSKEEVIKNYHLYNDKKDSLVSYCLGMHTEYTASDAELKMMQELIHELKVPFFIHISETKKEVEDCFNNRKMSPAAFLDSLGLYDFGGGGYHCIHFDDNDISIFKKHNLSVVSCPGSNCKLSSGIPPVKEYLEAGLNIALGTDGPASNNCLDMFKEMTLTFSLSNQLTNDPASIPSYEILKMATVNGAKAMGLNDSDILEVGKKADIIMIDLSAPNMQPINDIVTNIVYSGNVSNVLMTMIDGKILFYQGEYFLKEKVADIYKDCQQHSDELEKRYLASCQVK